MESDRLVQNLQEWDLEEESPATRRQPKSTRPRESAGPTTLRASSLPATLLTPKAHGDGAETGGNALGLVMPGTQEWAALRPPSILETPFSQPSFRSTSPELSEAKAINLFPHNNHSLQLIEPFPIAESKAVREVQKQQLRKAEANSPLRNPRRPPAPPQFRVFPPTPGDEVEQPLGSDQGATPGRNASMRRPGQSRRRSESLMSSLSRNFSLQNARNRKADQELDGKLHPFWRPRAFWDDDVDNAHPAGEQAESVDGGIVRNSLGLPQERTVVTGPVSLVRRISQRRRQKRGITKQSSHGSLAKLRATRQLQKSPHSGLRLHLFDIHDIHDRIMHTRQRKENEKREKRRADLRRSIGANVIMQGDSRFPASNTSLSGHE
jgi:hypothetical protein